MKPATSSFWLKPPNSKHLLPPSRWCPFRNPTIFHLLCLPRSFQIRTDWRPDCFLHLFLWGRHMFLPIHSVSMAVRLRSQNKCVDDRSCIGSTSLPVIASPLQRLESSWTTLVLWYWCGVRPCRQYITDCHAILRSKNYTWLWYASVWLFTP